jgi:hypothetical protein
MTNNYKIDRLITAARDAFLYLEGLAADDDPDSGSPSGELTTVLNEIGDALGAIGAHPHAETDRRPDDEDEPPF